MEKLIEMFPHAHTFIFVAVLAFLLVLFANVVDCIDAIITSRVAGKPIESAKLRHALWKLAKEWILLFTVFAIDVLMAACWTKLPFITVTTAIAMIGVEVLSMVEHARLRKDKLTKLPANIKNIVEYLGVSETELREVLKQIARKKLEIE